eukprot:6190156-Pleurochrysis_carterae.AAC.3
MRCCAHALLPLASGVVPQQHMTSTQSQKIHPGSSRMPSQRRGYSVVLTIHLVLGLSLPHCPCSTCARQLRTRQRRRIKPRAAASCDSDNRTRRGRVHAAQRDAVAGLQMLVRATRRRISSDNCSRKSSASVK